jgi:LysR family transcriptional activator of nhaA
MNYHHLFYFYTIAKAGSISKACEILNLSQPGLSSQLQKFEKAVKRPLFERHKKRLRLTEDGRIVLDYAERIFDMGQQLQDTLRDRSPSGRQAIQIGVMSGTARAFTDSLVSHLLKKNPSAHVLVEEKPLDILMQELANLNLDVIMTDTPASDPAGLDFTSRLIGHIPVMCVARTSLVRIFEKQLAIKASVPFVLSTVPNTTYQHVKDSLSEAPFKARIVAEVQDISVAGRLACQGHGIVPMSAYLMTRVPYSKMLRPVSWKPREPIFENLYFVTRNRQWPNPLASYLVNTFKAGESLSKRSF